ncbi:MAG: alpha/beta hydrolase, partial [Burkholderiaceae bacterium]|nr:alpha/beta hydrolase [Burkholderiaceae bacterium]
MNLAVCLDPARWRRPRCARAAAIALVLLMTAGGALLHAQPATPTASGVSSAPGAASAPAASAATSAGANAAGSARGFSGLAPCHIAGIRSEVLCATLARPLDPARPAGPQVDLRIVVVPALARVKAPDAVFFFAGGPGQSAVAVAPMMLNLLARLNNRRDLVFIDQRGTGKSAPLDCRIDDDRLAPLADMLDPQRLRAQLFECLDTVKTRPHGDLRFYTTTIAMADADAVRAALGYERINLIGGSYGTRAVLEYLRQFPQRVRRAVIDGVAPPDMVLPHSFATDNQAALEQVFAACAADADCARRHPDLRQRWRDLLARLPQSARLAHPLTGREETLTITRAAVANMVRAPLYSPALASALPQALAEAAEGRYAALLGLSAALGGSAATSLAWGMHFAVVCAEDYPRMQAAPPSPDNDFGATFASLYADVCPKLARGAVPEAFYSVPASPAPVLVLSGGADPVTPPRHGDRVARALGAKAQHVV